MTDTKIDPTAVKESFEHLKAVSTPTGFAAMIVSGVAQYGVHVMIKRVGSLFVGGNVPQKIAIAVATYIISWACQQWVKKAADAFTSEVIAAAEVIIEFFRKPKAA